MIITHQRKSMLYLAVLSWAFGLAAFFAILTNAQLQENLGWLFPTSILVLLFLTFWWGKKLVGSIFPGATIWLHPPVLISAWVFISFGLPAWYGFFNPDVMATAPFRVDNISAVSGMLLIAVGMLCVWAGYLAGLRLISPNSSLRRLARFQLSPRVVMVFYGVTIVAQLIQIRVTGIAYGAEQAARGDLGGFQQWLGYIQGASTLVLAIVALKVFRGEWRWLLLVLIVLVQVAFGFISGFMKPILWLTLILMVAAFIAKYPVRRLAAPAFVLAIVGILAAPVATNLRSQIDQGQYDSNDFTSIMDRTTGALADTLSAGIDASWQFTLDRFLYRQTFVAQTPTFIMMRTPSVVPYQGLEQFLAIPAYLIPSIFWPDKPILSQGNAFAITYLGMPSFTTSSAAITVFGEGYMIGGWLGTIIACLTVGLLLGMLYRQTVSVGFLALYLAMIPTFIDFEAQFIGLFVAMIQKVVVFTVIYWGLAKMSKQSAAARPAASGTPAA